MRLELSSQELFEVYEPSPGRVLISGAGAEAASQPVLSLEEAGSLSIAEIWGRVAGAQPMPANLIAALGRMALLGPGPRPPPKLDRVMNGPPGPKPPPKLDIETQLGPGPRPPPRLDVETQLGPGPRPPPRLDWVVPANTLRWYRSL